MINFFWFFRCNLFLDQCNGTSISSGIFWPYLQYTSKSWGFIILEPVLLNCTQGSSKWFHEGIHYDFCQLIYRQPTLWLHDPCMEVLTVYGTKLRPYSYYQFRAFDIEAVDTTFNVFSYDAFWAENWTHQIHYILRHRRGFRYYTYMDNHFLWLRIKKVIFIKW